MTYTEYKEQGSLLYRHSLFLQPGSEPETEDKYKNQIANFQPDCSWMKKKDDDCPFSRYSSRTHLICRAIVHAAFSAQQEQVRVLS
mgnify:CR=1 FL=1